MEGGASVVAVAAAALVASKSALGLLDQ